MQRVLDFCTFQSDLGITQEMTPQSTLSPGQPITYTLTYSNSGVATAQGVMITATVPAALAELAVVSEGATITPSQAAPYQWQSNDLAPGQSGIITVTGVVSPLLNWRCQPDLCLVNRHKHIRQKPEQQSDNADHGHSHRATHPVGEPQHNRQRGCRSRRVKS